MNKIGIILTGWYPDSAEGRSRQQTALDALGSWSLSIPNGCAYIITPKADMKRASFLNGVFGRTIFLGDNGGGVGEALNLGIKEASRRSPIVFYAADDWELRGCSFDFRPWVSLLESDSSIGMVRLGPPHPGISGTVEMSEYGWHLRLARHHFAFGHRPALYHSRMFSYYGWFKEGVSPLECEDDYNLRFCNSAGGPDIVLALPHPWEHIGEIELGYLQPNGQSNMRERD